MAEEEKKEPVQLNLSFGRGLGCLIDYVGDPDVAAWVKKAADRGLLHQALLLVGQKIGAASYQDVIEYLDKLGRLVTERPGVSLRKDFGNGNRSALGRLEGIFDLNNSNGGSLDECRYGSNTHSLILEGILQLSLTDGALPQLMLPGFSMTVTKPDPFSDIDGQMLLFEIKEQLSFAKTVGRILQGNIKACWRELQQFVSYSAWVKKDPEHYGKLFRSFEALLYPLIGDYVYKSPLEKNDAYTEYLKFLSWLTLGGIISNLEEFPFVFPEVRIFLLKHGARGGRIDGLEVLSIDGHPPTEEEKSGLRELYFPLSPRPSVGELIYSIFQRFGFNVCLRIVDIKCAVGDAKGLRGILWPEDIKEGAIGSHTTQIKQYLVLAAMSYHIVRWLRGEVELKQDIWLREPPVSLARLVYCFPNGQVEFPYTLSGASQKGYFLEKIAYNAWRLEVSNRIRAVDIALTNYVRDLARGKRITTQLAIPQVAEHSHRQRPFQKIVASYRQPVGLGGVAEYVGEGKSGSSRYILFADKLIELIEKGKISTGEDFSLKRDTFICCPFHRKGGKLERTPSCRLYWANPERATFHCFSCGASGRIVGRVDKDGRIIVLNSSLGRREDLLKRIIERREDAVITDEHRKIVSLAQQFMAADLEHNLQGQPGRDYLSVVRGLDLDLAFNKGFGFGTDIIPIAMLESGFSFEQLVKYGFISFSNRVPRTKGLVPRLKKQGLKDKDIMRDGAYPFFVFRDMVTVPLELLTGVYSSFYARSIMPEAKLKHRKLRVVIGGASVPHGAFNIGLLDDPSCQTLVLTEGVMDAMVLMMLRFDVMAILGADNNLIIDAVARSNKRLVALAFDRDVAGRKAALTVAKKLRELGFQGRIVNFNTSAFYQRYPEAANCKDINDWWIKQQT